MNLEGPGLVRWEGGCCQEEVTWGLRPEGLAGDSR